MIVEYYLNEYAKEFAKTDRNLWNYEDGCVLIGLEALYEATGREDYLSAIRAFIDRYISEEGAIRLYDPEEYNVDYIPAGRVLFALYEATGETRYRNAIESLMGQLRHQPRTAHGSFWHKKIYPHQVWLDGLYMALPFYALYEGHFGDRAYDDILLQFENARRFLYDEEEKLYIHAYSDTKDAFWADPQTGRSPNFWTRSIGWLLMAYADVYALLPDDHPGKERLAQLWREAMDGMLLRRDSRSGLFMQLPALPDMQGNYPETSGSLMVAYSLLKGARMNVFESERYARIGMEILMQVEQRQFVLREDGLHLGGICKGAGLGPEGNTRRDGSAAYYLSEEVVEDEQKGVGVLMMASAEGLRVLAGKQSVGPQVSIFKKPYDPIMPEEIARLKRQAQG